MIFVATLLICSVLCNAQIKERKSVNISLGGHWGISMHCFDAEMLAEENHAVPSEKFQIDSVTIKIVSPKVTEELNTEDAYSTVSTTNFKSKELKFIVSRKGYRTLEEVWKVTTTTPVLDIFLTKDE